MSLGGEKQRRTFLYDDPVDCGMCTLSRERKATDETRNVSEVHRSPEFIGMYGLFAGHGGATAADLCARNFVPTLLDDYALHADPERAIQNACQALEAFVIAKSNLDRAYYGTTLLFAMIKKNRLFVANIGNCRAVLATQDGVQTITQEHDGSNSEEVARVRNAGGFFQDGKVNNLIRVTRSIGDSELKERKHITFPSRNMTKDVVIATPDIYCRNISSRDEFLILATAEVWEHLSNNVVVQVIQESLNHHESPHIAAKKVALAAMQSGAKGPFSAMVLLFPTGRTFHDKAVSPPKKKGSRPSRLRRHSSNEQELSSMKAKNRISNTPAFVRAARAEAEQQKAIQRRADITSPTTSPKGSVIRSPQETTWPSKPTILSRSGSTPFLSLNVPPGYNVRSGGPHREGNHRGGPLQRQSASKSADSVIGIESVPFFPDEENEVVYSRNQIDMGRKLATEKRMYNDRKPAMSARAKTTIVSRISELTASGSTGGEICTFGSLGNVDPVSADFIEATASGQSKVRYREDGSVHVGRFGILKDFRRTFVRKR